ncbi:MAG: hypothetical protein AAGC74_01340 [Verrucomicrobiota bacterium]
MSRRRRTSRKAEKRAIPPETSPPVVKDEAEAQSISEETTPASTHEPDQPSAGENSEQKSAQLQDKPASTESDDDWDLDEVGLEEHEIGTTSELNKLPTQKTQKTQPRASQKAEIDSSEENQVFENVIPDAPLGKKPLAREDLPELDELGDLDEVEDLLEEGASETTESTNQVSSEKVPEQSERLVPDSQESEPVPSTPQTNVSNPTTQDALPFPKSIFAVLKKLTAIETVSLSLLVIFLFSIGMWAATAGLNLLPEKNDHSQIRFPFKGHHVEFKSLKTYWRDARHDGPEADEGVSNEIALIPVAKLEITPKSTDGRLRFLFRDETGAYVGDTTTLRHSGGKFTTTTEPTAETDGSKLTLRATTGFERTGELISYLADPTFRWHLVVLEEKEGKFYEILAYPISTNRITNK